MGDGKRINKPMRLSAREGDRKHKNGKKCIIPMANAATTMLLSRVEF